MGIDLLNQAKKQQNKGDKSKQMKKNETENEKESK